LTSPIFTSPWPDRRHNIFSRLLIVNGILNACAANDGLKDGMVFNTRACKFDPEILTCKAGKNDSCLTSQQTAAINKAFAGNCQLKLGEHLEVWRR
jgi:feruloyl esterase